MRFPAGAAGICASAPDRRQRSAGKLGNNMEAAKLSQTPVRYAVVLTDYTQEDPDAKSKQSVTHV
jgi:hypothetical protein